MLLDGTTFVVDWPHTEYVLVNVKITASHIKPTEPSAAGVVPIVSLQQQT